MLQWNAYLKNAKHVVKDGNTNALFLFLASNSYKSISFSQVKECTQYLVSICFLFDTPVHRVFVCQTSVRQFLVSEQSRAHQMFIYVFYLVLLCFVK